MFRKDKRPKRQIHSIRVSDLRSTRFSMICKPSSICTGAGLFFLSTDKKEKRKAMSVHAAREEEENWLSVALFATQCVEKVGLSSARYNHTHPHGKKKRPQRITSSRGSDKNKLMMIAYENKRKRDLWNADAELIMWNNLSVLVGHFERHLWMLVPLHPSVLQEDNVRFALMGEQSERMEDFPLLFNVNVAMACGTYIQDYSPFTHSALPLLCSLCSLFFAHFSSPLVVGGTAMKLVGHKQREEEFMMRARHQLEYLFDSSHIAIAEGLLCMAYYSFCQVWRHGI